MNAISNVTGGLHAAFRLAIGRPDRIALVAGDSQSIATSFWSILLSLPAVLGRLMMAWIDTGVPRDATYSAGREVAVFVLGWLLFVEVTYRLAPILKQAERWGRFIAVWNWCNVIEGALLIIGSLPGAIGAPSPLDEGCELIVIGWALWLEWFATRLVFGVSSLTAAWLVLVDQSIGVLLASLAAALAPG